MLKYVTKHLQIGTDKHADGKPQVILQGKEI